ncbi:phage tail protein [Herbaspirillum seropedicae]|uniref:phage tail protein n=1 Tax=Herbaspirillum seropedicae TaxID=964 RepID=UPI003D974CA0
MTAITCYQTDETGVFLYAVAAYPFPMEERLNVPFMAVQQRPPETSDGHRARWVSPFTAMEPQYDTTGEWIIEEIPLPAPPADSAELEAPDESGELQDQEPAQA